jgi:hypothetical protein
MRFSDATGLPSLPMPRCESPRDGDSLPPRRSFSHRHHQHSADGFPARTVRNFWSCYEPSRPEIRRHSWHHAQPRWLSFKHPSQILQVSQQKRISASSHTNSSISRAYTLQAVSHYPCRRRRASR